MVVWCKTTPVLRRYRSSQLFPNWSVAWLFIYLWRPQQVGVSGEFGRPKQRDYNTTNLRRYGSAIEDIHVPPARKCTYISTALDRQIGCSPQQGKYWMPMIVKNDVWYMLSTQYPCFLSPRCTGSCIITSCRRFPIPTTRGLTCTLR